MAETDIQAILEQVRVVKPDILIVDLIQKKPQSLYCRVRPQYTAGTVTGAIKAPDHLAEIQGLASNRIETTAAFRSTYNH